MKSSDKSEDAVYQTSKYYFSQSGNLCLVGMKKMQPGFVDFENFVQGLGFAGSEAIYETREFSKTHQVGFRQGCDTGVVLIMM